MTAHKPGLVHDRSHTWIGTWPLTYLAWYMTAHIPGLVHDRSHTWLGTWPLTYLAWYMWRGYRVKLVLWKFTNSKEGNVLLKLNVTHESKWNLPAIFAKRYNVQNKKMYSNSTITMVFYSLSVCQISFVIHTVHVYIYRPIGW
jgi:hypothetical protein